MDARYDDERVTLTPGFTAALEGLMREEMAMMRSREAAYADCWTWGLCTITDLARFDGLVFEFGGEDDRPDGLTGDVQVRCLPPAQGLTPGVSAGTGLPDSKRPKNERTAAARTYLGPAGGEGLDPAQDCPSAAQGRPAGPEKESGC